MAKATTIGFMLLFLGAGAYMGGFLWTGTKVVNKSEEDVWLVYPWE